MTDIVERLRCEGVEFHEQLEAAAEIERLRQTAIETMQEMLRRANEIAKWREENERLTADLAVAQANLNIAKANLHSERIINERLRALLEECRPYITSASHWDAGLIASVDAALEPNP